MGGILSELLQREVSAYLLPFLRIGGMIMVAPVFGARMVSMRVRVALCAALAYITVPLLPAPPSLEPLGVAVMLVAAQEVLVGVAMGFTVQMIFDALVIGGQTMAMSMGLGFAMMVDPQRGVSVPVLSQFLVIMGILVFLALNGHLAMLRLLVESFDLLPVGQGVSRDGLMSVVSWGSNMFAGALRVALPGVIALLVVNTAFGVMSRAAPTLNLFAVGFPVALLLGFIILVLNIPNFTPAFESLLYGSLNVIRQMLSLR
jgi:flagellar biosynthetic protein FliR